MLRLPIFLVLTVFILPVPTSGLPFDRPYGWTISNSVTDPYANEGPFVPGVITLALWYVCSTAAEHNGPGGMASAQFGVASANPTNVYLAFTPMSGFLDAGPAPVGGTKNLLLAVGGCPVAQTRDHPGEYILAGTILVLNNAPGEHVLVAFDAGDGLGPLRTTVDCAPLPRLWDIQWGGFADDGDDPPFAWWDKCALKTIISIEQTTWGQIKSTFR